MTPDELEMVEAIEAKARQIVGDLESDQPDKEKIDGAIHDLGNILQIATFLIRQAKKHGST